MGIRWCLQNLTGVDSRWRGKEGGGATYEISGGSVLTLPVRMDKGVWALAIIRTAEPIHRMSPRGTKQTKWPCSGSPSIPFSFYEAPVTLVSLHPSSLPTSFSSFYLRGGITVTGKRRVTRFSKVHSPLFSYLSLCVVSLRESWKCSPLLLLLLIGAVHLLSILYLEISNGYPLLSRGAPTF